MDVNRDERTIIDHMVGDSVQTHIYIETQRNFESPIVDEIIHINVFIYEMDQDKDLIGTSVNILMGVSVSDGEINNCRHFRHIPDLVMEILFKISPKKICKSCGDEIIGDGYFNNIDFCSGGCAQDYYEQCVRDQIKRLEER